MARVTVEDCLKNVDSRFILVHLAVRRVLQVRSGLPLTMENVKGNKEVVTALREIASNRVTVDNIRMLEESRPVAVEAPPAPTPAAELAVKAEVAEILDEATAFNPAAEFEGTEQFTEQDLERDSDQDLESREEE